MTVTSDFFCTLFFQAHQFSSLLSIKEKLAKKSLK